MAVGLTAGTLPKQCHGPPASGFVSAEGLSRKLRSYFFYLLQQQMGGVGVGRSSGNACSRPARHGSSRNGGASAWWGGHFLSLGGSRVRLLRCRWPAPTRPRQLTRAPAACRQRYCCAAPGRFGGDGEGRRRKMSHFGGPGKGQLANHQELLREFERRRRKTTGIDIYGLG
ncbi:unnamed protein product [Phaeothamnion confervicola]